MRDIQSQRGRHWGGILEAQICLERVRAVQDRELERKQFVTHTWEER